MGGGGDLAASQTLQNLQNRLQNAEYEIQTLKRQNAELTNALNYVHNQATTHLRKLTPQAYLDRIEVHLAEHCNLNCYGCTHFAQLAPEIVLDVEEYGRDMERLSELTNGLIRRIHLMGGEPLLNPNCKDFFAIRANIFPIARSR